MNDAGAQDMRMDDMEQDDELDDDEHEEDRRKLLLREHGVHGAAFFCDDMDDDVESDEHDDDLDDDAADRPENLVYTFGPLHLTKRSIRI